MNKRNLLRLTDILESMDRINTYISGVEYPFEMNIQ
jgi:uncharacterized protein with HEPN domain